MALRIEKAFGPKMDTLLRMQAACEIAEARDREADIARRQSAKIQFSTTSFEPKILRGRGS
jgi:plasmid maintenance system antidote protein VapI